MNRRGLFFLVLGLLLTSPSAFAGYVEAELRPKQSVILVGEVQVIEVQMHLRTGLNPYMWGYTFGTDRRDRVALDGLLHYEYPIWSGTISVTGKAPGTANIVDTYGKVWATVEVQCGYVEPLLAVGAAHVIARPGQPVKLAVTWSNEARVLRWYVGRAGDDSYPLGARGTELEITPAGIGTHYVWASSKSPCASSAVEFRIDVGTPRRRAAGR